MTSDGVVTVFGGSGFLGRAIVRRLARAGASVRVASRRPYWADFPGLSARLERWPVDVRDPDAVAAALRGAGAAVNAVSLYVEGGGLSFDTIHVDAAGHIAEQARQAGLRQLVHVSGIGVDTGSPSPYVRARARGEQRVRAGFPQAAVLRPSVLFGPGDSFVRTLDAVSRMPVIPLFSDGSVLLQPVYVEDVAEAALRALQGERGGVFELGGRDVLSYRAILQAVMSARGRRRPMLPVPFGAWRAAAALARVLPSPPLTRDQVVLMQADNVADPEMPGFAQLGIEPHGLLALLPECLP